MSKSWTSLFLSVLQAQASRLGRYVASGSWVEITHSEEVAQTMTEDNKMPVEEIYTVVDVVLTNMCNTIFHSGTFLLPSKEPLTIPSSYRAVYNVSAGFYEVITRETGQHNYKPMTIPYNYSPLHIQDAEVSMAGRLENSSSSITTSRAAPTAKDVDTRAVSAALLAQVGTSPLVQSYYCSPSGDDWANPDEEEQSPLDGADAQCSESHGLPKFAFVEVASSLTTSPNTYVAKNVLNNTELQDVNYEQLSRAVIALDLGLSAQRRTSAWSKVPCVQSLDLRILDINTTTLAEWIANDGLPSSERVNLNERSGSTASSESSVADYNKASSGHQVRRKEEANIELTLPNLRQYIPGDTSQDVHFAVHHSYEYFKTEYVMYRWAHGHVDWFHMCRASERLLASGESQRRPLFAEAGRSPDSTRDVVKKERRNELPARHIEVRPVHHYNFNAKPVYCKSSTDPAVSFWAASSPALQERNDWYGGLRRTVISSEAAKYVDPFLYHGPQHYDNLTGTALRDQVTGQVERIFTSHGTWMEDSLDMDTDQPFNGGEHPVCYSSVCEELNRLPQPYKVSAADGDILPNDDGRRHPPAASKNIFVIGRPSRLSWADNAYDVEDLLPALETPCTVPDDHVSAGEELSSGLPQQDAVCDKEDAAEQPEADNAVRSSPADSCPRMAAWLAKIHHLSSLPIEEKTAYLYAEWSPPSKTSSRNRQDLTKWSEQTESSSNRPQDLTKWSEEPEILHSQRRESKTSLSSEIDDQGDSYLDIPEPGYNRASDVTGAFADESVGGLSSDETGHVLHPEVVVHVAGNVNPCEMKKSSGDVQFCTRGSTDKTDHEDSRLSFESGKDILLKVLKDSEDSSDVKSGMNGVLTKAELEQPHTPPMRPVVDSPAICFGVGEAAKAGHAILSTEEHQLTTSLDDDPNFPTDEES